VVSVPPQPLLTVQPLLPRRPASDRRPEARRVQSQHATGDYQSLHPKAGHPV